MTATCNPSPATGSPQSLLPANLAALWATDPALARRIEPLIEKGGYQVESTRTGLPTLALHTADGRRLYLHSRHHPAEEARRLIDGAKLDGRVVFCIHGLGLGYHVEELFARASDEAMLIVLEPDLRLILTAMSHRDLVEVIRSGRLVFITEADRSSVLLKMGMHQAMVSAGLGFVAHPPSVQLNPEFHRQTERAMAEFVAFCRTSLQTLVLNGKRTCENIAANVGWYVRSPGINDLMGRHAGRPAIIVSAGPSLRKNKHLLRDAAGRAVLVAVQTTLLPLLEMGVEPDYVTSLDYHDICTRFFEKLPRGLRTELVAEPKASGAVLELYPGPMRLLGSEYADRLLREMTLGKDRLRAGATVAHLAFYLAEYMGCDPIIFVGQDLGFSDGLCYTPGTGYEDVWRPELGRFCTMEMKQWEHIARERPILRQIADWQGRPMYTEERLFSYLQQFERDFATSRNRIIDATEGGALKRGATAMTLSQALERFCPQKILAAPVRVGSDPAVEVEHRADRSAAAMEAANCLRRRREEAGRIQRIGRETLPLLQEVRDHLDDQPRVNRLIARIDRLRAQMMELNDTYDLITQLSQQTELARFQADRQLAAARVEGIERQRRQASRDIANVSAVIEAAQEFEKLMDRVIVSLEEPNQGRAIRAA